MGHRHDCAERGWRGLSETVVGDSVSEVTRLCLLFHLRKSTLLLLQGSWGVIRGFGRGVA